MDDTTKATIPSGDGGLTQELKDARTLLTSVRRTLVDMLELARDGDLPVQEVVKKQAELERAVISVFNTEQKYNEWVARETGKLLDGEIDFDTLRDAIGCRLDRLRSCCQDGAVS
jgi:hypothetical protein